MPDLPRQTIHKHQWVFLFSETFCIHVQKFYRDNCWTAPLQDFPLTHFVILSQPSCTRPENLFYMLNFCLQPLFFFFFPPRKISFLEMVDHLIFNDFVLLLDIHRLFKVQLLHEHHGKVSSISVNPQFCWRIGTQNIYGLGKNSHPWFCWIRVLIKPGCWFWFGCIISNNIQ